MRRAWLSDERGLTLVELLVTLMITSIVTGGITSVVMTTHRSEQYQRDFQEVIDDGRISIARIRQELRTARRVHFLPPEVADDFGTSNASRLHFWVDQNQDALVQPEEQICYVVEPVGVDEDDEDVIPERWQISRWSGAMEPEDCVPGGMPEGSSRSVVARTLVDPEPFVLSPTPGEHPADPPTREATLRLNLEVLSARGPDAILVTGGVRLRNVP
jgi:prepilin-type N-terminal cleavage/methylation domain-containing protein